MVAAIVSLHERFGTDHGYFRVEPLTISIVAIADEWTGRDNTHYAEKCWRVESAPFGRANPTRRVHAVWGGSRWQEPSCYSLKLIK